MNRSSTKDVQDSENTPRDVIMVHVIISLSKPTECTTPTMSPNVNYGLWMIMTCQCRLINVTSAPLWWGMLIVGGGNVGAGDIRKIYTYLPFNFAVDLKLL